MLNRIFILLYVLFSAGCSSKAQQFVVYKKEAARPVIVLESARVKPVADTLSTLFEKATGTKPLLADKARGKGPFIELSVEGGNKATTGYFIKHKDNTVHIKATDVQQLYAAIQHFFAEYAGVYIGHDEEVLKEIAEISIPAGLAYQHVASFEYREPYFPDNFNARFRQWNNTHTLEDTWGLWGHNIGKAITVTSKMLAIVDGELTEEQFCFSSPELQAALEEFIKIKSGNSPNAYKFMVMPNDNELVCQCASCKNKGNTKTNASPAVFSLLNTLAGKFPAMQFFSTAYITTQQPPAFKLVPNAGVMISTMAFPKGVVLEKSNKKQVVEKTFSGWKEVTGRIYLWDYAINFDNYFDAYPTVTIAQQNLKYYRTLGVTGVFMQGSEDNYAAFADLKCYLYAQLLQNTDIDIHKHIKLYFESKYPSKSNLFTAYYSGIEKAAYNSARPLDIYGGIRQSQKKYLDYSELNRFYGELAANAGTQDNKEQQRLAPLLAALTYQRLELLRSNGFERDGYAAYNDADGTATLKPEVPELLKLLKEYTSSAGITVYNESGATVTDYIKAWETEITATVYKNCFYGKPFRMVSEPDEDYPNVKMLNDGNIGFTDYYNNWLLKTGGTLALEINPVHVKGTAMVEISFLNDARHNIYVPERVVITIDGRKYEASPVAAGKGGTVSKYKASIPIVLKTEDKTILIEVVNQKEYKSKSIACDEIIFK